MKTKLRAPKVILFSTPTCSWCKRLKSYFVEKRVKFKEIDVSKDKKAANDLVKRTGQMGVPVTLIGNKPVIGFDKAKIDKMLHLH